MWGEYFDLIVNGNQTDAAGHQRGTRNNLIYNNTLASRGSGVLSVSAVFGDVAMTGTVVQNNIFAADTQIADKAQPPPTVSHNLPASTDPLFVDAAHHAYRLREGSPAIDAGIVVPGITDGYAGAAPDEGAYEYGSSQSGWIAGCTYAGCA